MTVGKRLALSALAASVLSGCVAIHAPLAPDAVYPSAWGALASLGPECTSLSGVYRNAGRTAGGNVAPMPVFLASVLGISTETEALRLSVETRRIDRNGDTFCKLNILTDWGAASPPPLDRCFCVHQTLVCGAVRTFYWGVPGLAFGGSQSNLYISRAADQSLIVKEQQYQLDLFLVVPFWKVEERWMRFEPAAP